MSDDLREPVRVSLYLFQLHRQALWTLRADAGMVSESRILRNLIREASPATVEALRRHVAESTGSGDTPGQVIRPSLLLDAADLDQLDRLAEEAKAPSRSAVVRFLILDAMGRQHANWPAPCLEAAV